MADEKEKDIKAITEDTNRFKCPIQKAILFLDEFIEGPMCARCLPCPMGSYEMRVRYHRLAEGQAAQGDIEAIKNIAPIMLDASMCKKGKDTAKFILDTMETLPQVYEAHTEGACPDRECVKLIAYRVIPDKCVACDECRVVCKDFAILGEKRKPYLSGYYAYEVVDLRCSRCGKCAEVCKYGAIEIVNIKDTLAVKA
ncbi:MAG: 4Fe-4S binding protein [Nitrospirae bacterium YQR-1]